MGKEKNGVRKRGKRVGRRERRATNKRRQLEVISDEDERLGEPEGTEADRKGDLGGLVNDAVVEFAAGEDGAESSRTRRSAMKEEEVDASREKD